ncbi:DUF5105 domain-containing protein [Clostridium septicum]|uniref:DUF5105 domain-containing protein n=1 Tax=Clostridium septicum TaxID=1504 RepID=UPI000831617E|nr:DUF5105 domain-containing protein [Clostridium septicum]MDU1314602.1 DUF5105 domain-containing protein [Clostridium septicum]WLF69759.1 DUF5105 domain-containing protein [Clostridium septicum]
MKMKKATLILSFFILILTLVGCKEEVHMDSKETVTFFIDSLCSGDFKSVDKVLKYPKYNKLITKDEKLKEMYSVLFAKCKVEILDIAENGNLATVNAKVNSVDLSKVEKYITANTRKILQDNNIETTGNKADDALLKETIKRIKDSSTGFKETKVNIYLEKENNQWIVTDEGELINAMEGN